MAPDASTLASIASVIAAFGSAMIIFRVQREEQMRSEGERVWLPLADWLLVVATLSCLLLIILPISAGFPFRLPAAASAASAVVVAGCLPSSLPTTGSFWAQSDGVRPHPRAYRTGPRLDNRSSGFSHRSVGVLPCCDLTTDSSQPESARMSLGPPRVSIQGA